MFAQDLIIGNRGPVREVSPGSRSVEHALAFAAIEDRRRMREALQENEEKYRTILDGIEEGYFEVDLSGNLRSFNQSLARILGYPPNEMPGLNNRRYMSEKTVADVYRLFNHVYQSSHPAKAFGWELIRKDGQKRFVETSISIIRNPEGAIVGFRGIARDVTESRMLEKARERTIEHLSHELTTPLSILIGVFDRIEKISRENHIPSLQQSVQRGLRSLDRLIRMRDEINDIMDRKTASENGQTIRCLESALGLVQEMAGEEFEPAVKNVLSWVATRLESVCRPEPATKEKIPISRFLDDVCEDARRASAHRDLEIITDFQLDASIHMDRGILKRVCGGLLRNAIENTPDEGRIEIRTTGFSGDLRIDFKDYGIGITPSNQKMIFGGFFHTQDTALYCSKSPYHFNAGGAGADLLRMKVLSERHGFLLGFQSERCRFILNDSEQCPGRISMCPHVRGKEGCFASGGSTFTLGFATAGNAPLV